MPLFSQVHTDGPLANLSVARPPQGFAANSAFPILNVAKKSDLYYIYDDEQSFRRQSDDSVNPGSGTNQSDAAVTTGSYTTGGHGLHEVISAEDLANADVPIALAADAVERLVQKLSVNKEVAAATSLNASLTGSQTAAANGGVSGWNNTTTGTPIADIIAGIEQIETAGGVRPNVMIMDSAVWHNLRHHPDISALVVSGQDTTNNNPANISTQGVANLFGFDEVVVSRAVKNTAIMNQTPAPSRVWSDDCYILHSPPSPGLKSFSCGKQFTWLGGGAASNGFRVRTWFDNKIESDVVEVKAYYDLKIVSATAGYRISNCTN